MKLGIEDEDKLIEAAQLAAPYEACGVVLENGAVVQCRNDSGLPGLFQVNQKDLEDAIVANMSNIAAVWHTHPGGRRTPSRNDLEHHVPDYDMIIVTLTEVIYCGRPQPSAALS